MPPPSVPPPSPPPVSLRLLARLKWHESVTSLAHRALRRRARWRYPLLMILPRGGAVAEIGVWRGRFSALLREALNPRELILIDPWSESAEELPWQGRTANIPEAHCIFEAAYREVRDRFAADPRVKIIRAPSLVAVRDVPDGSLDAVYIDGAHGYEDVRADLRAWMPKLRPGGMLTGDDYTYTLDKGRTFPVRRAVDEFVREIRPKRWAVFRSQYIIQHS